LTDLLRQDHQRMKELFDRFEDAQDSEKKRIIREALTMIGAHDAIEKRVLYPAAKRCPDVDRELVLHCEEAHHVVNILLTEIKVLPFGERSYAKFSKVCDGVREHIEEEESELFPALEKADVDLDRLGERARALKRAIEYGAPAAAVGSPVGVVAAAAAAGALGWLAYRALTKKD
jgi:hemerythrin superfamily protein